MRNYIIAFHAVLIVLTISVLATQHPPAETADVADEPIQQFDSAAPTDGVCVIHATQSTQNVPSNQGSVIRWRGAENPGASPLAVLQATKDQLEREQKTKLGSDATARAMVLVMQAIAELEGKQTEMPDGTPIIQ